ncbi:MULTISPECIES: Uma2 family endonuclease [unclassified Moorena]|uniref:Uma2 family endonuclease n=1 Tax=unclassified Moorena TaxID=2683338 RepID=UPI0013B9383F|nr:MULTISPECIES: Uma2 family endonuclease [unclassified Moorena]NEP30233.1 Uma2 family endonuclease [Moorena sp. SIO3B2]NER88373.1 Uma2 family endonuclease [Moorena sp. SIO3A2]NET66101.1 Uma2 family endonuclease [Moorena sp. SIO1G6]
MILSATTTGISPEEFIAQYGDDERYELIDGELIEMEPTGPHEQVVALISRKLNVEIDRLDVPYFIPHRCLIQPLGTFNAFRPDLVVLDEGELVNEPLWAREPVITLGTTVKLVVEVVSTNWQNDYARKYEDYEALGIPEYWIVDYLGIGGKYFIGSPKQPTVTVCCLVNDQYQNVMFRRGDCLKSYLFPNLKLSTDKLFIGLR